jgi:hypothetical protein
MTKHEVVRARVKQIISTQSTETATDSIIIFLKDAFTRGYSASSSYIRTADEACTHDNAIRLHGYEPVTGNISPKQPDTYDPEDNAEDLFRKSISRDTERKEILACVNKNWPDNPTEC